MQVSTLKDGTTLIGFPALPFPSLHGKVWMSSVFSSQFVSVSPSLFTVARARRWAGSFFIYTGISLCTDAFFFVGLSRFRKSADILVLTTGDRICPYTLCAKDVIVVYSLIPELLDELCCVSMFLMVVAYLVIFLSVYPTTPTSLGRKRQSPHSILSHMQ